MIIYKLLGYIYGAQEMFGAAINYNEKALEIAEELQSDKDISDVHAYMGGLSEESGDTVSAINFVTSPAGLPVTWTNSNTIIGLPASGNGDITDYLAPIISGDSIQTATISATTMCSVVNNFTIGLVPQVLINSIGTQRVCSGVNTSPIFISTNSSYSASWTNSNISIGLASSGIGQIPSFLATSSQDTAIITAISVETAISKLNSATDMIYYLF